MFRENEKHRQKNFFSGENLLPKKMREQLLNSWAGTFYKEVFAKGVLRMSDRRKNICAVVK